jgi:hypothetical protein
MSLLDKILPTHPTIYKYDRTWIGVLLGLTVPFSGILIIYILSVMNHYLRPDKPDIISLQSIIHSVRDLSLLMKYMSVGCMLNLGIFFFFVNRDYFNVSRGIIFATILISIPVMIIIVIGWFR